MEGAVRHKIRDVVGAGEGGVAGGRGRENGRG